MSAQDREIEAGAGLWLLNPARVADFDVRSTPSVDVAWNHWYVEQSRWTVGVHAMPRYGAGERMLFGHVTYRRQWIHDDEGSLPTQASGPGRRSFTKTFLPGTHGCRTTSGFCGTWRR